MSFSRLIILTDLRMIIMSVKYELIFDIPSVYTLVARRLCLKYLEKEKE